ncbi:cyclic di-GMP phosphodiesterase YfgF [Enterobacter cancerogenus]|uniref:Cyclic di-GMP phosphodiesterase YfgF n=1 Tax=Enterobacter cancerogenus TaxID=69218 RepID=A0A484YWJ6_9ENTR|nr:cyclic di-GMP phosphodiesterase YfgF [Enterobacter cancerogenus]
MPVFIYPQENTGFNRASMKIISFLKHNKDRWWALPLVLPPVLLPLLSMVNTYTQLNESVVVLYYFPLSFFLAMMVIFDLPRCRASFCPCFIATIPPSACLKPGRACSIF